MSLETLPLWAAGLLLVGVPTLLAMAGPFVVRRFVTLERLSTNNEVAGFKYGTLGTLYAVLLAFIVIVVWQNYSEAESDVSREAGAAATIYRLVDGLDAVRRTELRGRLTDYLETAMSDDWAAMANGRGSPAAQRALDRIYASTLALRPADAREGMIQTGLLEQLGVVTDARRARIIKASGIVPDLIWIVLFGGAFLTIGFTLFFGTENVRAQALMTGALTMLIFSGLLIVVAIEHPFEGAVKVDPLAIAEVLEDLGQRRPAQR